MPGSWPPQDFPNLTEQDYVKTSDMSMRYNCIAWAAGDTRRKWWPDPRQIAFWPHSIPRKETVEAFHAAFRTLGYVLCDDGSLEVGFEKIALYAIALGETLKPTHAARQLADGQWTSKLGDFEDISHIKLESLNGPRYGEVIHYMKHRKEGHGYVQ